MNEELFKRLRWIMIGAIVIDAFNTLWGQPGSYWSDPSTAAEHNTFVRYFARLGSVPFICYWVVYAAVAWGIVSLEPRRFALVALFTFILPHYFGAASWWVYAWDYGSNAATAYGFVLAVALGWAFGTKDKKRDSP